MLLSDLLLPVSFPPSLVLSLWCYLTRRFCYQGHVPDQRLFIYFSPQNVKYSSAVAVSIESMRTCKVKHFWMSGVVHQPARQARGGGGITLCCLNGPRWTANYFTSHSISTETCHLMWQIGPKKKLASNWKPVRRWSYRSSPALPMCSGSKAG